MHWKYFWCVNNFLWFCPNPKNWNSKQAVNAKQGSTQNWYFIVFVKSAKSLLLFVCRKSWKKPMPMFKHRHSYFSSRSFNGHCCRMQRIIRYRSFAASNKGPKCPKFKSCCWLQSFHFQTVFAAAGTYLDNILSIERAAPKSWLEYKTLNKVQHPIAGRNIPPLTKSK